MITDDDKLIRSLAQQNVELFEEIKRLKAENLEAALASIAEKETEKCLQLQQQIKELKQTLESECKWSKECVQTLHQIYIIADGPNRNCKDSEVEAVEQLKAELIAAKEEIQRLKNKQ